MSRRKYWVDFQMDTCEHGLGGVKEKIYLKLINYTCEHPYENTPRQLASMFNITQAEVYYIGKLLGLDIIGRADKNRHIEIEALIKYEPHLTAHEMEEKTGVKTSMIYEIAKRMNHRFETIYTRRAKTLST